jgi:hypothetical protein
MAGYDNCVAQREQIVGKCGPQNEAKNESDCAEVFKKTFTYELVEITVHEMNTYAEQKIQTTSLNTSFQDAGPETCHY